MSNTTQLTEFEIFQTLSGNFLCQEVPDNWENLSQKEQTEFIEANKWQPLEYLDADKIYSLIQDATDSLKSLFKPSHSLNINLAQDYSISWCIEDVYEVARDKFSSTISHTDAQKVLAFMASTHNACIGINWDTIYYSIEHLLEQNSISLNQLTSAFPEN